MNFRAITALDAGDPVNRAWAGFTQQQLLASRSLSFESRPGHVQGTKRVPNQTVCSASETSRCFDGIEHTSACLKPRKYCAAITGFPQIRPGFGQTVSSHRQSPNRHPARATYLKVFGFPPRNRVCGSGTNPNAACCLFSINHPKRGKFSRNFLLSQVVLSMEAEAGPQPRRGSPRRLASSRTVSRGSV